MTTPPPVARITPHQARVLTAFLHDGASNATIGRRLGISEQTVKTHMHRILRATGCPDRTSLAIATQRRTIRIAVAHPKRTPPQTGPVCTNCWATNGGHFAHCGRAAA